MTEETKDGNEPTELSDVQLEEANGGHASWPSTWKVSEMDGKSNLVDPNQKTIIGGFKTTSGMTSPTEDQAKGPFIQQGTLKNVET
ncbi:MAG: hypothetical protein AB8B85_09195 [Paracoccaceae bacterium]